MTGVKFENIAYHNFSRLKKCLRSVFTPVTPVTPDRSIFRSIFSRDGGAPPGQSCPAEAALPRRGASVPGAVVLAHEALLLHRGFVVFVVRIIAARR